MSSEMCPLVMEKPSPPPHLNVPVKRVCNYKLEGWQFSPFGKKKKKKKSIKYFLTGRDYGLKKKSGKLEVKIFSE